MPTANIGFHPAINLELFMGKMKVWFKRNLQRHLLLKAAL